jgi:hypothetical protein
MKFVSVCLLVTLVLSCAPTPTPPASLPAPATLPTPATMPTAVDTFYNAPATYTRQLGNRTQTVRLGVSADFATRPILPFFGLSLTDTKFAEPFFEAITYNHFFRWQEADWAVRSAVAYDDFKRRLSAGEDLSYPAMDTSAGAAGAHVAGVNPAADMDILLIPRHDGFVTFPGSPSDPGLSIKTTIHPDGSLVVRAPLVYAQVITYKKGDAEIQELARAAIILALMELGIPTQAIASNDLKAISAWWETQPEKDLHRYQYSYLAKLLTDGQDKSILHLWDEQPQ